MLGFRGLESRRTPDLAESYGFFVPIPACLVVAMPRPGRASMSGSKIFHSCLTLCLLAALSIGCDSSERSQSRDLPKTNLILISIDTLRPDHLGCYGYDAPTSPNVDRLCEDGITFEQTIAQAPSTLHSHASILTSLLPHHHQATWGGKTRLPEEATTLAEVLRDKGYSTAAFTGGGQMDRVFGLDQGFDSYIQPGEERFMGTVRRAIGWLDENPVLPFFLFLHSYEVHHPYEPSPEHLALIEPSYEGDLPAEISIDLLRQINRKEIEIEEADLAHIVSTYDAEVRSMDDALGVLIETLRQRDLYDDTVIVFTSDHGEEFGEHGVVGWHSHTLYDELLRVPLILKLAQSESPGVRVGTQVRSIDIAPTILAALGFEVPDEFDGLDLTELTSDPDSFELDAVSRMDRAPGRDISAYRTPHWKLVRKSLFNLEDDPKEQWDLALSRREIVEEMQLRLDETLSTRDRLEPEQVTPTDSTLDELRALGYIE